MTDNLRTISAGDGRSIAFTTDGAHRITAARSSTGGAVKYEYDRGGHLARVIHSDGRVQEYTYGAQHEVRTIRDPDRNIVNTYDASVRCIKQVITRFARRGASPIEPEVFQFSYRTNAPGRIVETRVIQPSGMLRVATFNVNGYLVTDTTDPEGPTFTQVVYARDDKTNLAPRVTVRCAAGGRIVEAVAAVSEFEHPDEVRGRLVAKTCRAGNGRD